MQGYFTPVCLNFRPVHTHTHTHTHTALDSFAMAGLKFDTVQVFRNNMHIATLSDKPVHPPPLSVPLPSKTVMKSHGLRAGRAGLLCAGGAQVWHSSGLQKPCAECCPGGPVYADGQCCQPPRRLSPQPLLRARSLPQPPRGPPALRHLCARPTI